MNALYVRVLDLDLLTRLQAKDPALFLKLYQLDMEIAEWVWGNGHTISYNVALAAKNGNPIAQELCQVFSDLLQPNHCQIALQDEP